MPRCPACDQEVAPVNGLALRGGALFSDSGCLMLGPVSTAIVRALLVGPLMTPQLAERVYGYAHDAPAFPENTIRATMVELKRKVATIGWTIENVGGRTSAGALYRLVEIMPQRKAF